MLGEFFYFLLCFLVPRLITQWNDTSNDVKLKTLIWVIPVEFLLFLPLISLHSFLLFIVFIFLYHAISWFLNKKISNAFLRRIIELLFLIIAGGFLIGIFKGFTFNENVVTSLYSVTRYHPLFLENSVYPPTKIIIILFGVLVLANEMNGIIRYILGLIKTEPEVKDDKNQDNDVHTIDTQELSRGKIIGVIERVLFFFFVLTGNYGSIAFILAAKGFTRFRELEDKNFAEYVLIGTLLSSSLSIFWAFLIRNIIEGI
jgi:hypothetical protein